MDNEGQGGRYLEEENIFFAEEKKNREGKGGKYLGEENNFFRMSIIYEAGMIKRGCQDEMFAENILLVYWFRGHRR